MTGLSKIKHEADAVWIEGVPVLKPKTALDLMLPTFAGALYAALSVTEHAVSYEDILGMSGLAFRVRWYVGEHGPTGCPCAPCGETKIVNAALKKATGWQLRVVADNGWDTPQMQQLIPEIIKSINSGIPITAVDRNLNSGVIYGYADDGETFLVRTYYAASLRCKLSKLGQKPALACFPGEHTQPLSLSEIFSDILQAAVEGWRSETYDTDPAASKLKSGRAALEAWINLLSNFEKISRNAKGFAVEPFSLLGFHVWAYQHLFEARKAAAAFLRKNAGLIPAGKPDLLHASENYQAESELLASVLEDEKSIYPQQNSTIHSQIHFHGAWNKIAGFSIDRADMLKALSVEEQKRSPDEVWQPEARKVSKRILEQALELENEAIGFIESALSSDG
ncbi:hypothetical protein JXJ21_13855 [candidate division KSB1 bacterium]|nr:hypothetical protein [candidate division KSB1 bacterium]